MNREVHVRFWESAGLRCPAPLDYRQEYRDLADARASIERFIEKVYNAKRLHSALGYCPPLEFEQSLPILPSALIPQPPQQVTK